MVLGNSSDYPNAPASMKDTFKQLPGIGQIITHDSDASLLNMLYDALIKHADTFNRHKFILNDVWHGGRENKEPLRDHVMEKIKDQDTIDQKILPKHHKTIFLIQDDDFQLPSIHKYSYSDH